MAILKNNRIYGVMGDLVYYTDRSGNQRTRKRPVLTAIPSDKQLGTRMKFKMAVGFLNPLRALVNKSWHNNLRRGIIPYDDALGTLIRQGIDGEYPDLYLNYHALQMSCGKLDGPLNIAFNMEGDEAVVTWESSSLICSASAPDDILMFVLVNEKKESRMVFEQKALRADLSLRVALPDTFGDDELHGFFFFVNHNFKDASGTSYLRYGKVL